MNDLQIDKYVLIGSYPLGIRFSKDIDVICYEKDIKREYSRLDDYSGSFILLGKRVEVMFADKQESFQRILENHKESEAAYPWELFAIKRGHINFPHRQWIKHIHDYHTLKLILDTSQSLETIVKGYELAKIHKKCTEQRLGVQRLPKLNGVTKEEFFDDAVVKYYVHDDIHKSIAHKEKPMYEYMQEDTSKVECSKRLWNAFPVEDKIKCVLEECYTIALERHIIPSMKTGKAGLVPFEAFKWALMRVCTNLCSGWFRDFAVENYFAILNNYNPDFVQRFKQNIDESKY